jgi:hypothetical protein
MKRPFSDTYLLDYSGEHLYYELSLLYLLTDGPALEVANATPRDIQVVGMALLESWVIHLRNVIAFLFHSVAPDETDVVAGDFLANWPTLIGAISPTLSEARRRANKEIAHLTTARIPGAPKEKEWDRKALWAELLPIVEKFGRNAPHSRLHPKVRQLLGI